MLSPGSSAISQPPRPIVVSLLTWAVWLAFITWLVQCFRHLTVLVGVSVLLSYLLMPLVDVLQRAWDVSPQLQGKRVRHVPRIGRRHLLVGASAPRWCSRLMAVVMVYALAGLAVILSVTFLLPPLQNQLAELLKTMPQSVARAQLSLVVWLPWLSWGHTVPFDLSGWLSHQTQALLTPENLPHVGTWVATGMRTLVYAIACASLVFYLLLDGPSRANSLLDLLPEEHNRHLIVQSHRVLQNFVRGQVLLAAISGVLMLTLYLAFGVPHALALSCLFTVAEIFPVIGPWFAFTPGIVVMLSGPNPWVTLYVLGIYALLKDNIILPKVVGDVMGMHPIWIILALLLAAHLAGPLGVIFAVPVAAILQVWITDRLRPPTLLLLATAREPILPTSSPVVE